MLLTLTSVALLGPSARAQTTGRGVDPAQALETYRALETWVRDWQTPQEPQTIDPHGATGACVTLRYSGVVVGRATHLVDGTDREGQSVWLAAREAIIEASEKMPVGSDALRRDRLLDAAQTVTIDLQIAGELTPLGGRSFQGAVAQLAPGIDGVAARAGSRLSAVFPGAMLASNLSTNQAMSAAVNALELELLGRGDVRIGIGDPRISLGSLKDDHGLTIYRFRVQHLAQPSPGAPARFLFRGGRVVTLGEISISALRDAGDGIARHILSHRWPGDEPLGLMGTYRPWVDAYAEPIVAAPEDQALAAFALIRYGRALGPAGSEWVSAGVDALSQLSRVEPRENDPAESVVASALFTLAARAARGAIDDEELSARSFDEDEPLDVKRRECAHTIASWATGAPDQRADIPGPGQALVALALAGESPSDREAAADIVRRLFRETEPGRLVNLMPWLGWAEIAIAADDDIPAAIALRDLRDLVWSHQVSFADAGDEPDLVGGIVFTASSQLLPSWQSARPLALVATMLGDERLTDEDEVAREIVNLLRSLRWLVQLTVKQEEMHMFRERDRALGGVRLAPWDQRLALEASSMSLLAIAESLKSVEARRADVASE